MVKVNQALKVLRAIIAVIVMVSVKVRGVRSVWSNTVTMLTMHG
jgi:hypothetical protein